MLVVVLVLSGAVSAAAASDTTAPSLVSLAITPSSVDVTSSSQTFAMTAHLTDGGSGVDQPAAVWIGPGNIGGGIDLQRTSGDAYDGTWTGTVTVPRYLAPGDDPLDFQVGDMAGNWMHMDAGALGAAGFPASFHVADANPDTAGPHVSAIRLSSQTVDARAGDATLTIEADVDDAPAGIGQVDAGATGPRSSSATGPEFVLTAGTATSGTWRGSITIPQHTSSGTWTLTLHAFDAAYNMTTIQGSAAPSFSVVADDDTVPPSLAGLEVNPIDVDVAVAPASVAVRVHATDNFGIQPIIGGPYAVDVALQDPVTYQSASCLGRLVQGSATDGLFDCTLTIAASSATSTRDLEVWLTDTAGNQRHLTTSDLEATGLPAHVVVRNGSEPVPPSPAASSPASAPSSAGSTPPRSGYAMVSADGRVYGFGGLLARGNAPIGRSPAVDIEATPTGNGYWLVSGAGEVYAFGDASYFGGSPTLEPREAVTSISAASGGAGYWLFTTKGRVIAYGNARTFGDMSAVHLNGPVLDSIPTPSGAGYYMVASDGGVFTFGDAVFHGSMGGAKLNQPVQSLVPDPDGVGYWLVASDGGIFSFDAPFYGSMGDTPLNKPITGMVGAGNGYLMVGADGGIFTFGDISFLGSLGDHPPAAPVVSVAAR